RRTGDDLHARDLAQRDMRHLPALARDGDEDVFERLRILPKLARIADVDRETAPALHGGGDRLAADGRLDHLVDVRDVQAVARQRLAIGHDVQVEPTEAPFEEGGAGARNGAEHALEVYAHRFDRAEVLPVDLDPHRRADAGGEH